MQSLYLIEFGGHELEWKNDKKIRNHFPEFFRAKGPLMMPMLVRENLALCDNALHAAIWEQRLDPDNRWSGCSSRLNNLDK